MKKAVSIFLAVSIVAASCLAQSDSLVQKPDKLSLWIETVDIAPNRDTLTVDIMLDSHGSPIAGADLKIGYDSYLFEIEKVTRGDLPDSCNWEMFDTKLSIDQGKERYPRTIAQIVTLAEIVADSLDRKCKSLNRPVSLARLKIIVNRPLLTGVADTLLPIYFFWTDCSDNTITDVTGTNLMMSSTVDGVASVKSIESDSRKVIPPGTTPAGAITFPSKFGAPDLCIKPHALNKPVRMLELKSGGVRLKTVVEKEKSDN